MMSLLPLAKAVEDNNTYEFMSISRECLTKGIFDPDEYNWVKHAFAGFLDQSSQLHLTHIPDWNFLIRSDKEHGFYAAVSSPDYETFTWEAGDQITTDVISGYRYESYGEHAARAWLASILKAMEPVTVVT